MSDIIATTQHQEIDSGIIYLYDLEIADNTYLYFINHDTSVDFDGNTYIPFPIMAEGFEHTSTGAYNRPTLKMANVDTTLYDYLEPYGGIEKLTGKRLVRRTTLVKYLGISSNIEYPRVSYIIDRISEKNSVSFTMELAAIWFQIII